jgi:hypothetical protein
MSSSRNIFLTNTNYFQWKSYMEDLLRSKGLYQNNLGKETKPIDDDNKFKWDNRNDKARGLIIMSISLDLRFRIQQIDKPNESWEKILLAQ